MRYLRAGFVRYFSLCSNFGEHSGLVGICEMFPKLNWNLIFGYFVPVNPRTEKFITLNFTDNDGQYLPWELDGSI